MSCIGKEGVCCSCKYAGAEETPCLARKDGTHCVHWWEGPEYLDDPGVDFDSQGEGSY